MLRPPPFSEIDAAIAALGITVRQKRPSQPGLAVVASARRLLRVVQPRRASFAALSGFDVAAIDSLPELIAKAEGAEIEWADSHLKTARLSRREARDEAVSLRFRLVSAARRLGRDEEPALLGLKDLDSRRRLPNLVADLESLADLVDRHAEAFAAVQDLPPEPARAARDLAERLTQGPRRSAHAKARGDRNAATALLSMALYEIRCAGRFLFRYEPELLAQLADPVLGDRKRRRRSRPKPD